MSLAVVSDSAWESGELRHSVHLSRGPIKSAWECTTDFQAPQAHAPPSPASYIFGFNPFSGVNSSILKHCPGFLTPLRAPAVPSSCFCSVDHLVSVSDEITQVAPPLRS
jgi:hypothetical protein